MEINSFEPNVPFLDSLKTSETFGFLTFSRGIEMAHWAKMG